MRVSLIGPVFPFRGGIAHYTACLAEALRARHSLQVITYSRLYPSWLYPGQTDREEKSLPFSPPAVPVLDSLVPTSWWRTLQLAQAHGSECVIMQWWTPFLSPSTAFLGRWMRRRGMAVCFLVHNVLPHERRGIDRWAAKLALAKGSGYVVHTQRERQRLESVIGRKSSIVVQPHPIYSMFRNLAVSRESARRELGLEDDDQVILFFGFVREYKGIEHLLHAFRRVRAQNTRAKLLVAGEVWAGGRDYPSLAVELGLSGAIRWDDRYIPNDEVAVYFTASDVFAAPYVGGTQSGSAKIAVDFGLSIVATPHIADGIREVQGSRLYVVPPSDDQALAEGLQQALSEAGGGRPSSSAPSVGVGWSEMAEALIRVGHAR